MFMSSASKETSNASPSSVLSASSRRRRRARAWRRRRNPHAAALHLRGVACVAARPGARVAARAASDPGLRRAASGAAPPAHTPNSARGASRRKGTPQRRHPERSSIVDGESWPAGMEFERPLTRRKRRRRLHPSSSFGCGAPTTVVRDGAVVLMKKTPRLAWSGAACRTAPALVSIYRLHRRSELGRSSSVLILQAVTGCRTCTSSGGKHGFQRRSRRSPRDPGAIWRSSSRRCPSAAGPPRGS